MSYNTRNYNTRTSGGGRQGNYNTSGQFVPASSNGQAGGGGAEAGPMPLQQRAPRANTVTLTPNNDYAQMYNSSPMPPLPPANNFPKQEVSQDVDMKAEPSSVELSGGEQRPAWMKSKLPGVKKVSNKERRRRQNETLRRLLSPKNAVMVLNEVLPEQQIANNFRVEPTPANFYGGQSFAAEVTVDGQSFKGYGDNKLVARTKAAEQAFRDLMLKKMTKVFQQDAGSSAGPADEDDDSGTLPMLQLASFALHKLFAEWENEGHKVPALRPVNGGGEGPQVSTAPPAPRALPANAADMHPCMLLTYMCPRTEYREVSSVGAPPSCVFTMAVIVDNHSYTASAKSKKEARRLAAKAACEALYQVQFSANPTAAAPVPAAR